MGFPLGDWKKKQIIYRYYEKFVSYLCISFFNAYIWGNVKNIRMKKILTVGVLLGCLVNGMANAQNSAGRKDVPVLNVEQKFSCEDISVESLGKVRYISFKAAEDVLLGDQLQLYPGEKSLFFCGRQNGEVVGFDLNGNFLGKFNRKGQGAEEYGAILQLTYDESAREVCLLTQGNGSKLFVFGLQGEYKRSYSLPESLKPWNIASFDDSSWLIYDIENTKVIRNGVVEKLKKEDSDPTPRPFILLDKQTGKEKGRLSVSVENRFRPFVLTKHQGLPWVFIGQMNHLITDGKGAILNDPASDFCYRVFPDRTVKPLLSRMPSAASMKDKIIVSVQGASSAYLLIKTILLKPFEGEKKLRERLLLYKTADDSFTDCKLIHPDYNGNADLLDRFYSAGNRIYFILYPHVLIQAMENKKLSGDLLTLTKTLDEEDNLILLELTLDE